MKDIKIFREQVRQNGVGYQFGNGFVVDQYEDDKTIHINQTLDGVVKGKAFLMHTAEAMDEMYIMRDGVSLKNLTRENEIGFVADLCEHFNIENPLLKNVKESAEKTPVDTDPVDAPYHDPIVEVTPEQLKAEGKAEAYENILMGREITIGK